MEAKVKSLRIEFFQNPPRERVLVDGVEQTGVAVEVAFLDGSAGEVTIADFVYRLGKSSTAGSGSDRQTTTTNERETSPVEKGSEAEKGNDAPPTSNGGV